MKLAHLHYIPHGFFNQTSWKPQSEPNLPLILLNRTQWDEHQFVPQRQVICDSTSARRFDHK